MPFSYVKNIIGRDSPPRVAMLKYFDGLITSFKHSPQPQCLVHKDGWFVDCNVAWCKLFGRTNEELQRMKWQDVTHPDDIAPDEDAVSKVIDGKMRSYAMDKRYKHKDGHFFPAHLVVFGSYRDDLFSIFASFATPITGTEAGYGELGQPE